MGKQFTKGLRILKYSILTLLIALFAETGSAQLTIISGSITGVPPEKIPSEITVDFISGNALDYAKPAPQTVHTVKSQIADGRFKINMNFKSKFAYIRMQVLKKIDFFSGGYMLIESGDQLSIHFDKGSVSFLGDHSQSIQKQYDRYEALRAISISTVPSFEKINLIQKICKSDDSLKARSTFSTESYELLFADHLRRSTLFNLAEKLRDFKNLFKGAASDSAMKYVMDLKTEAPTNEFLINSSLMLTQYQVLIEELKLKYNEVSESKYFESLIRQIQSKYGGLLLDRMNALVFWRRFERYPDAANYLKNAIVTTKDVQSKSMLEQLQKSSGAGQLAFNFSLPDEKGEMRSLSEFKGKIVICHFWFNGCWACVALHDGMTDLIKMQERNPDIVFVNINVDVSKKRWLDGLQSGQYSGNHEVNLYTDGLGINHPLVKHYNYINFPQMLIIDQEGKLISSNPPKPNGQKESMNLIKYLDQHLNK